MRFRPPQVGINGPAVNSGGYNLEGLPKEGGLQEMQRIEPFTSLNASFYAANRYGPRYTLGADNGREGPRASSFPALH